MGKLSKLVLVLALGLVAGWAAARAEEEPTPGTKEIEVGPAPVEPPLAVKLWADRETNRYRVGEKVTFFVEATKDCYLTLLNIGTSGQVKLLLPNQFQKGHVIKGGIVHNVPTVSAPFELTFVGPPGTEGVMAICALDDFPLGVQPMAAGEAASTFRGPVATVKDIEVQLKPVPKERWATATLKLDVEPRNP